MVRKLFLVRHGETLESNSSIIQGQSNTQLTAVGETQAVAVGDYFSKHYKLQMIFSSDLDRAAETANLISSRIDYAVPLKLTPALREISCGVLEGSSFQLLQDLRSRADDWEQVAPLGGETFDGMRRRVLTWYQELIPSAPDGTLIVSHRGPMTVILEATDDHSDSRNTLSIVLRPCTIIKLELDGKGRSKIGEIINVADGEGGGRLADPVNLGY